jgi:hypothetical protein
MDVKWKGSAPRVLVSDQPTSTTNLRPVGRLVSWPHVEPLHRQRRARIDLRGEARLAHRRLMLLMICCSVDLTHCSVASAAAAT